MANISLKPIHIKAKAGVRVLKPCMDCPNVPLFESGGCPGINLMKQAYSINFEKIWFERTPSEPGMTLYLQEQQTKGKKIGCEGKTHFLNGLEEFNTMLKKEFSSHGSKEHR